MDVLDVLAGVWYMLHLVCALMWPVAIPIGLLLVIRRIGILRRTRKQRA